MARGEAAAIAVTSGGGDGEGSPPSTPGDEDVKQREKEAEHAYQVFIDTLNQRLEAQALPYFRLISGRVATMPPKLLWMKMTSPLMLELIHSYWLEQGLLVRSIDVITARYANVRYPPGARASALYRLEIEPLRRVNNILWGYVQDQPNRLTVARRAYEYLHAYGLPLHGQREPGSADPRTQFVTAFHNLLYRCLRYFEQWDDLQVIPDPQGVFSALKEVQLLLGEGAHNQFGELPFEARAEMLVQQWIVAPSTPGEGAAGSARAASRPGCRGGPRGSGSGGPRRPPRSRLGSDPLAGTTSDRRGPTKVRV